MTVSNGGTDAATAPRLFGQPVEIAEQPKTSEYTISSAKVPLASESYLSFLYNTTRPTDENVAQHRLAFKVTELEYNIEPRIDIPGYQDSSWLKFIIPLNETHETNNLIGQINIPIPLRAYPFAPSLIMQQADIDDDARQSLDRVREWKYSYRYEHMEVEQDTILTRIDFNGEKNVSTSPPDTDTELFDQLAHFIDWYPEFATLLEAVKALKPGDVFNNTTSLHEFADLITHIASAWVAWQPDMTDPATLSAYYSISEDDDESGNTIETTVTLSGDNLPTPEYFIPGREQLSTRTENGKVIYQFDKPSGNGANLGASNVPDRMLSIPDLDIIGHQSAQAELWLTRNVNLGDRETNPAFVYQTPLIEFTNPLVPYLENTVKWNIADIVNSSGKKRTLDDHLQAVFDTVLHDVPNKKFAVQLECRYAFALVDIEGVEHDLLATLPVILGRP
ncbi:MAG TPA: hypothetical protein VJZ27_09810, partial [Aggregatilineales bacterium]|nr:hypothetical protein [Aggregatilineales bacterium]